MSADRPTHVVAKAGDRRTLCGLLASSALPLVAERWVQAHVEGHGIIVCAACAERRP